MTKDGHPIAAATLCALLLMAGATACGSAAGGDAEPAPTNTPSPSTTPIGSPSSSSSPSSPSVSSTAASLPPPQPQQAKATLRWLATDGAPLLRFHRTAVEWRPGRTRAECKRIGDQLDRIGTPEQIMLTIAGVEDEPLQSMLNAEVRSLAEAVTNCANGSSTTPAAGLLPLAELTALVEQRLRALRAVR